MRTCARVAKAPADAETKESQIFTFLPAVGGALSLGTGLVFTGELNGNFDAWDAKAGTVLWHFPTGSTIEAPPSSYTAGGKQYIVVASGQPGNQLVPELPKTNAGSMVSAFALP